jgi:hypothetical protein
VTTSLATCTLNSPQHWPRGVTICYRPKASACFKHPSAAICEVKERAAVPRGDRAASAAPVSSKLKRCHSPSTDSTRRTLPAPIAVKVKAADARDRQCAKSLAAAPGENKNASAAKHKSPTPYVLTKLPLSTVPLPMTSNNVRAHTSIRLVTIENRSGILHGRLPYALLHTRGPSLLLRRADPKLAEVPFTLLPRKTRDLIRPSKWPTSASSSFPAQPSAAFRRVHSVPAATRRDAASLETLLSYLFLFFPSFVLFTYGMLRIYLSFTVYPIIELSSLEENRASLILQNWSKLLPQQRNNAPVRMTFFGKQGSEPSAPL